MNLVPYDPFEAGKQLNKIFDNFFNRHLTDFIGSDYHSNGPSANVYETDAAFTIELATPGFFRDDLTIDVKDRLLSVRAETVTEPNDDVTFLRREFTRSPFVRTYQLPDEVDAERVDAAYQNGILTLTLPKYDPVESAARRIEIK